MNSEDLDGVLAPPSGANVYIKRFLANKGLNNSQAAKLIGVNQSTVKRLLDGGSLSESMAAKLYVVFDLDIYMLFKLEAKAQAFKARYMIKSESILNDLIAGFPSRLNLINMVVESEDHTVSVNAIKNTFQSVADSLNVNEVFDKKQWADLEDKFSFISNEVVLKALFDLIYENVLRKAESDQELEYIVLPVLMNLLGDFSYLLSFDPERKNWIVPFTSTKFYTLEELKESYEKSFENEALIQVAAKKHSCDVIQDVEEMQKILEKKNFDFLEGYRIYPRPLGDYIATRKAELLVELLVKRMGA